MALSVDFLKILWKSAGGTGGIAAFSYGAYVSMPASTIEVSLSFQGKTLLDVQRYSWKDNDSWRKIAKKYRHKGEDQVGLVDVIICPDIDNDETKLDVAVEDLKLACGKLYRTNYETLKNEKEFNERLNKAKMWCVKESAEQSDDVDAE